ncbi:thiol:disulfide interchange protein DsbD [Bacteroidia bacterium]|nr:thiol:disulfide interchange protein DsbD [Bacteroidia bacterium]
MGKFRIKNFITLLGFLCSSSFGLLSAQSVENPVVWRYSVEPTNSDHKVNLIFSATIDPNYSLYSQDVPENGPLPTEFHFNDVGTNFKLLGKAIEKPVAKVKFDAAFELDIKYHKDNVQFIQTVELLTNQAFTIAGTIDYMVCTGNACQPYSDIDFNFAIKAAVATPAVASTNSTAEPSSTTTTTTVATVDTEEILPPSNQEQESIWGFIFIAILTGLATVLTPCVFPMIPMTVSFFFSDSEKRFGAQLKGLVFCLSVALIYGILGLIVALTKSADFANTLSTHWIANLIFAMLFIAFALSFFGLYEIILPTGLSNKLDAKVDNGGIFASFFLAAVLTLVSFSCTGPFVATLLIEAVSGTSIWKPIGGMFAFGLAMGFPFLVFSFFPALMKKMPKSGGWLNSVKVVFAFILLALSMKFLVSIDLVYGLNIFSRTGFLCIWIVIFTLMGFYLLGKIRFEHDSEVKHLSIFRLFLVIATFSFVLYLIPGLFGAPLKMLSSLLPPASESTLMGANYSMSTTTSLPASSAVSTLCGTPRYSDKLHLSQGLHGYFDYDEGLACAKQQNKPVLLVFKGHTCSNCKVMEANVWSDPEVLALMNRYLIIALYTDDKTELPENEWVTSKVDHKVKKTMGKRNLDFQIDRFKTNQLPYYVILDANGATLTAPGAGDVQTSVFIDFLTKGL